MLSFVASLRGENVGDRIIKKTANISFRFFAFAVSFFMVEKMLL